MTEAEATSWANALHEASDEGVFFGASNYYTYIARRPKWQCLSTRVCLVIHEAIQIINEAMTTIAR
jgi:hypothetical protein